MTECRYCPARFVTRAELEEHERECDRRPTQGEELEVAPVAALPLAADPVIGKMDGAERDPRKPVKVTVSDPETGAVFEEKIVENNYVLVTAGNRYLDYTQVMGATHILCIKREKP